MKLKADNEIYIDTIEEVVEGLGLKLVYYKLIKQNKSVKAVIDVHKPDGLVSHDDCNLVVRWCRPFLEEQFGENVILEVSSPGVNRILKTERELKIFKGCEVEVYFRDKFVKEKLENNENSGIFLLNDYKDNNLYLMPLTINDDNPSKVTEQIINKDAIGKRKLLN